jgi:putative redox protein
MDGPPDHGGENKGPRPMEMVLMGVGGCSSFDVVNILKRLRAEVTDCECRLTAQRAENVPSVFTSIHLHFSVTGKALKDAQVKRAVSMTIEKYCSAAIMLKQGGVEITADYEIFEA